MPGLDECPKQTHGDPLGDARWEQTDLAGSMYEWTLDLTGNYPQPCNDCARLGDPFAEYGLRIVRVGAWFLSNPMLLCSHRGGSMFSLSSVRWSGGGFRCARAP